MRWAKGNLQVFEKYGRSLGRTLGREHSFACFDMLMTIMPAVIPVSYTHLDVYKRQGYDKMPFRAKFFERTGKSYLGMTGKFHTDWGEFGGFKPGEALKFEVASMMTYGARCSIGDQMHPSGKMDMETYRNIGYAYNYAQKIEEYCLHGRPTAKLGIYLSKNDTSNEGTAKIDVYKRQSL